MHFEFRVYDRGRIGNGRHPAGSDRMIARAHTPAHVVVPFIIGVYIIAGLVLTFKEIRKSSGRENISGKPCRSEEYLPVGRFLQIVGLDSRRVKSVSGSDLYQALALWNMLPRCARHAWIVVQLHIPAGVITGWRIGDLNVVVGEFWAGFPG